MYLGRLVALLAMLSFSLHLAAQTADITVGCAPLQVSFTAPNGLSAYFWDFKDGANSSLQNPQRIFVNPGTYAVVLREGQSGATIGTVQIRVFPKPTLALVTDTSRGCVPFGVQFTGAATVPAGVNVNTYRWTFGDGATGSGQQSNHTYGRSGLFTVSLGISTSVPSCDVTQIFTNRIRVNDNPVPSFTTDPANPIACNPPLTVRFNNTTPGTGLIYRWNFGNTQTSILKTPPPQTYTTNGSYTVTLQVTDTIGCVGTANTVVGIGNPVADFIIPDTVCLGYFTTLTNSSPAGAYEWTLPPSVRFLPPTNGSSRNPDFHFTQTGNQTITLKVTAPVGGCSGTISKTVFVQDPSAAFNITPADVCKLPADITFRPVNQNAAFYIWTMPDGSESLEKNPVLKIQYPYGPEFANAGKEFIPTQLVLVTTAGCADTLKREDLFLPILNAGFYADVTEGCAPLNVSFTQLSEAPGSTITEYTYLWGDGTRQTFTNSGPHTHNYTNPGEYNAQVIVKSANGCIDTSYVILIEVGSVLSGVDFTVDKSSICPGDTVTFKPVTVLPEIDAWHFNTDGGRSSHCFTQNTLEWPFISNTGTMNATLTVEYNGCRTTVTKNAAVEVKGPLAKIDYYLADCNKPQEFVFKNNSQSAGNVTWKFGDGMPDATADSVYHVFPAKGDYQVILTAVNAASGCPASSDTVDIHVRRLLAKAAIPDVICLGTPYDLNAGQSEDVQNECFRGFTWEFSKDRPITTQDLVTNYTFTDTGTWTIKLIVRDINGCRDTAIETRLINYVFPQIAYTPPAPICAPVTLMLMGSGDSNNPIIEWNWSTNTGVMVMGQNVNIPFSTLPSDGSLKISLDVKDSKGCPGQADIIIPVYKPDLDVVSSSVFICVGDKLDVQALLGQGQPAMNYAWDFGNGQTAFTSLANATYNQAGSFLVKLNATEQGTGCQYDTSFVVNVQAFPVPNFTSSLDINPGDRCYPKVVEFMGLNGSTNIYEWDFGNGQSGVGEKATGAFGKGKFKVTMTVSTTNGCAATLSKEYELNGPEGDFTFSKDSICRGEAITLTLKDTLGVRSWSWDFGDGSPIAQNGSPITHQYGNVSPGENITTTLLLEGIDGCKVPVTNTVTIRNVRSDFARNDISDIDSVNCVGEPFLFLNLSEGANQFSWNFGDGSAESNIAQPSKAFTAPGTYTVRFIVTNQAFGCIDTLSKRVSAIPGPTLTTKDGLQCTGQDAQLTVQGYAVDDVIRWTPANLLNDAGVPDPIVTTKLTADREFTVTVTNAEGCSASATATARVLPPFTGNLVNDLLGCVGQKLVLPLPKPQYYTFSWSNPEGLSCLDCPNPELTVRQGDSVEYTVTLGNEFGVQACNLEVKFFVSASGNDIQMPNAFTPDADMNNDFFRPVVKSLKLQNTMTFTRFDVFNRWGQKVYTDLNPQGWSGHHNDNLAPMDTYLYIIEGAVGGCPFEQKKGQVLLIR